MHLSEGEVIKLEVFPSNIKKRNRVIAWYLMAASFFIIFCIIYSQKHYSHFTYSDEALGNKVSAICLIITAVFVVVGLVASKSKEEKYIFTDKRMLIEDRFCNISLSIPYENIRFVSFKDYLKTYRYGGMGGHTGYLVFLIMSCIRGIVLIRKVYKTGHYKPELKPYGGIIITYTDEAGEHTMELKNIEKQEAISKEICDLVATHVSTFRIPY